MKASFAYISCQLPLVALLAFAPRVHGAESAMELTAFAFKRCNDVVKKTAGAENFDHQRLTIREDYTVDLFIAKVSQSSKTTPIVVWIEDGPGLETENPRITAVCVGKQLLVPPPNEKPGWIAFRSAPGDNITIRFHLDSLKISKWKKKMMGRIALANDSILMKEFAGGTPPKPGLNDWPSCLGKKLVLVGDDPISHSKDTEISFDFSRCANPGGPDLYYEYKLILAQYPSNGGPATDYPIDPLIVNHP